LKPSLALLWVWCSAALSTDHLKIILADPSSGFPLGTALQPALLSKAFKERRVEEHYRVTVNGELKDEGSIELPIDGQQVTTHYIAAGYDPNDQTTLLNVTIESGRKHQIRRHLAAIGYPLAGDPRYGDDDRRDMNLIARQLAFSCPTTSQWVVFSVPLQLMDV
jgi:tRNA pseudouridine32 synthase/23S rRNA pseudouridine746 synthase